MLLAIVLTSSLTCADVRAYVDANGKARAWIKAVELIAEGKMTWGDYRQAKRCLKSDRRDSGQAPGL